MNRIVTAIAFGIALGFGLATQELGGIRPPVHESRTAVASPVRVQGSCPIPSCAHLTSTTVRDVHWNEPGERYAAIVCERCGNVFAVRNRREPER